MSEAKHTPGPWVVRLEGREGQEVIVRSTVLEEDFFDGGMYEPTVADLHRGGDGNIYTAHLIAAAPELLEALQLLDEAYCNVSPAMTRQDRARGRVALMKARAAIAKATSAA